MRAERQLGILTKTYAPDVELFELLHESILRYCDADVIHTVVVDDHDHALFSRYESSRCRLVAVSDVLPKHFVKLPVRNYMINTQQLWPPLRGWVVQQLVKLAVAEQSRCDLLLLIDSDVVLTGPVSADTFLIDDKPVFFRNAGAVHREMSRHLRWHSAAREMLGLSKRPTPPLNDYVAAFNIWIPEVVRALRSRVEDVTGDDWLTCFGGQLHVSEFILYGVYVDEFLDPREKSVAVSHLRCHNYWDDTPLDLPAAMSFIDQRDGDDVALMISAKSGTPLDVRRKAIAHAQG